MVCLNSICSYQLGCNLNLLLEVFQGLHGVCLNFVVDLQNPCLYFVHGVHHQNIKKSKKLPHNFNPFLKFWQYGVFVSQKDCTKLTGCFDYLCCTCFHYTITSVFQFLSTNFGSFSIVRGRTCVIQPHVLSLIENTGVICMFLPAHE